MKIENYKKLWTKRFCRSSPRASHRLVESWRLFFPKNHQPIQKPSGENWKTLKSWNHWESKANTTASPPQRNKQGLIKRFLTTYHPPQKGPSQKPSCIALEISLNQRPSAAGKIDAELGKKSWLDLKKYQFFNPKISPYSKRFFGKAPSKVSTYIFQAVF